MAIVRYDPFQLVNSLHDEINRMFESSLGRMEGDSTRLATSQWHPAMDIKEEEGRFLVTTDLPGMDPKEVEVTLENGILTIQGHRALENREERNGYRRVERASGTFLRRISLPDTADAEKVGASYRNGVLEVTIDKREAAQPKRISVQVQES